MGVFDTHVSDERKVCSKHILGTQAHRQACCCGEKERNLCLMYAVGDKFTCTSKTQAKANKCKSGKKSPLCKTCMDACKGKADAGHCRKACGGTVACGLQCKLK